MSADRMPQVGQAVPMRHRPAPAALRCLTRLVAEGVPADAAERLRDPRIGATEWPAILAREVAATLGWVGRRALAAARAEPSPAGTEIGTVVGLLPRHGEAVHLLRRVLPFAVLGLPVSAVGRPEQRDTLREQAGVLAELTGTPRVGTPREGAADLVQGLGRRDLVVLTGAPATLTAVRRASPARVLAATGGCTLLVGRDPAGLGRAARLLEAVSHPGSCTSLGGAWSGAVGDETWSGDGGVATARDAVAAAHPSVIYRLGDDLGAEPAVVHGYTATPCDERGVVGTLVGFGRDPVGGWPGDFLV
jgi:hypothetical protein